MSKRTQRRTKEKLDGNRNFRVSKFAHFKLKVSLFFDGIFESISTPVVHVSLLIVNIALVLLLAVGMFIFDRTKLPDDDAGIKDDSDEISEGEKEVLSKEALESAMKNAMILMNDSVKPKYPFMNVNSWGEIKATDDRWFTRALFDAYVFLLSEMKISSQENTRKVIDIILARMSEFFNNTPQSNSSRFLRDFFREHLLLRSYDNAETDNPSEIMKNLGGNEFDVAFLVLATLSKTGITPGILLFEEEEASTLSLILPDNEYQIHFSQRTLADKGRKLEFKEFLELFLKLHISHAQGIPQKVKLNEFLEDFVPSTEVFRDLCKLYSDWEKITESPALKQQYREKANYYRKMLPNDNPGDIYSLAQNAYENGNIQEAWDRFNELVDSFADFVPAEGESAYYYLSLMGSHKFVGGAVKASKLSKFLSHLRYDVEKHRVLLTECAYLFFDRNKFNEALKIFDNLEKRGFADVRLYSARSEIYKELHNFMPSIANLKAAIMLERGNRKLRAQLIQMLIDSELYIEACKECELAAKSEAKMTYALKIGVFIAEVHLNNLSLAEKMLALYVQLNPEDEDD